ncbi:efflux RND transporter periplasmic adaptor subunit [Corynebacterium frankenforstense]|uniref:efflux RND transporter periplasmic adaptor subunit n=1 Tax=Corynebacterium frankenforstense TaxID=1230998 RepID=UPI0012EB1128|nr:HlyD family efflux transporter periplasmic adaptor subunit [Corynebacterium frankenforstense]
MKLRFPEKRRGLWIAGAVLLALVLIALIAGFALAATGPSRSMSAEDFTEVEPGDLESRVAVTGRVEPAETTNVTTRVTANVASLHVGLGDQVQEGQVVAEMDTTEMQRQLDSLRGQLADAEASGAEQISQAESAYAAAQAGGAGGLATGTADMTGGTGEEDAAGGDADAAGADPQSAAAAVGQARQGLASTRRQLQNQISALQEDIYAATLRAPSNGVVVSVDAKEGAPAQGPVVTVGDPARLVVRATVNEADAGRIHTGDEVALTTPATGDRELKGTVAKISPVAEPVPAEAAAAGAQPKPTYPVEIEISGTPEGLPVGATAKARVLTDKAQGVLSVPRDAVFDTAEGSPAVLVLAEGEGGQRRIEKRAVTPGLVTDFQVEVTGGPLRRGDLVVNRAADYRDAVGETVAVEEPADQPGEGQ